MDLSGRAWRLTAAAAVLLLAVAAVLIVVAQSGTLSEDDREALARAASERTGSVVAAAVALTTVGNTVAMFVLAVVVGAVLWWRGRRADGVYLVATAAGTAVVFTVIKRLLDRPRPPAQLQVIRETNESLPSGHATMAAAVIGSLLLLAWPHLAALGRTLAAAAAVLWVGAVGTTRIYLGVHWLSDVLAGWALGIGLAVTGLTVLYRWRVRRPAGVS